MARRAGLRRRKPAPDAIVGLARVDKRTKDLSRRMQPGDVAVINHTDIDRVAAENLIAQGAVAVINGGESISGRYPNGGPIRIVEAGVPLIDDCGPEVLALITEGDQIRVVGNEVWRGDELVVSGTLLDAAAIEAAMEAARGNIGVELEKFAENTLEYIQREAKLTFEPIDLPPLRTEIKGRHALVVVRGHDYRSDLAALKPYLREYQPVMIGVDGGADALLEIGFKPDIIIGDFDSVSDRALRCGAELIHHVHLDGRAPGRENLLDWGVPYVEFVIDGTSEDVAMLLAYEAGAQLIVAVGTHATMVEFLDKGRKGMSSTFLTRLRLGPMLVDAKGVSRLYEGRVRRRDMVALIVSALVAVVVISVVAEPIHVFFDGIRVTLKDLWYSVTGD
ncbi:MAG TPA: putative cytokinetic ring protein SteA [Acidimicrobiia bacterium]|jgi:uncharacterized membrane-anchored protein